MIVPEEVEDKEFIVGVRGFVREEVRSYLRHLAAELRARDERIAQLEARVGQQPILSAVVSDQVQRLLSDAEWVAMETKSRVRDEVSVVYERASELLGTLNESQERIRNVAIQVQEALSAVAGKIAELPAIHLMHDPLEPHPEPQPEPERPAAEAPAEATPAAEAPAEAAPAAGTPVADVFVRLEEVSS